MSEVPKWPKQFPPLSPDYEAIHDAFVKKWLETLPTRYAAIERFNHTYPVDAWKAHAQRKPRPRTLEVGPGIGAHLEYEDLARQDYHAIELRQNLIEPLRARFPQLLAVQGSIEERTPFEDGQFDRVVAIHVLEHLRNLPAGLDEIRRILAPDGVFTAVVPVEGGLAYSVARRVSAQRLFEKTYKLPYKPFIEREHVNTYAELRDELQRRFRVAASRRWPLPGLPVTFNLVVGLTLAPS
jgi:SAM-dependent methyltransferase